MRTAKETFYFVEDVMKMLGLSRSKAYLRRMGGGGRR